MLKRLRSLFQSAPAPADPYDQFIIAFVKECRRQRVALKEHDPEEMTYRIDKKGFEVQAYLGNCFGGWLELDAEERAAELSSFVRGIADSLQDFDPRAIKTDMTVTLRARTLVSNMQIQSWSRRTFGRDTGMFVDWSFSDDLAAVLVIDRPDTLCFVAASHLDGAGLSRDEAMTMALANVRTRLPRPEFERTETDGVYGCRNLREHQSSLLLMKAGADFDFPPVDGDPVVLAPARDLLLVTGSNDWGGLLELLDRSEAAPGRPYALSPILLTQHSGRWQPFAFDAGTPEAERQALVHLQHQALHYQGQKKLLDDLHERIEEDVYVASFMILQEADPPGPEFSVGWLISSITDTLLPVTERVGFAKQIAGKEEERILVAWADCMAIVGHLFLPVPNLYPPRYRVLSFPDAREWQQLKARAVPRPRAG